MSDQQDRNQELIIKAIDDATTNTNARMDRFETSINHRVERLEKAMHDGFSGMNGRVRSAEDTLTRIKTFWSIAVVVGGFLFHLLYDFLKTVTGG